MKKIIVPKNVRIKDNLKPEEIKYFMDSQGISAKEMSDIFGVTIQCVWLWLSGEREFSVTNTRLIRLFQKNPTLIREF